MTSREWNKFPAEVVLSPSLTVFKEKATTFMNNNPNKTSQLYVFFFKQLVRSLTGFTSFVNVKAKQ